MTSDGLPRLQVVERRRPLVHEEVVRRRRPPELDLRRVLRLELLQPVGRERVLVVVVLVRRDVLRRLREVVRHDRRRSCPGCRSGCPGSASSAGSAARRTAARLVARDVVRPVRRRRRVLRVLLRRRGQHDRRERRRQDVLEVRLGLDQLDLDRARAVVHDDARDVRALRRVGLTGLAADDVEKNPIPGEFSLKSRMIVFLKSLALIVSPFETSDPCES